MRSFEPSPTHRRSAGFSLIELMVVVGIIMIALAVATPNIMGYLRNYRLRGAAQEVVSQLQAGRMKAISKNVNIGVVFIARRDSTAWVIEDDLLPRTGTDWTLLADVDHSALVKDKVQSPGWQLLPTSMQLDNPANCPGGVAGTAWGLRFSRLGSQCVVGGASCAPPGAGASDGTLLIGTANGNAELCLLDTRTSLRRRIILSPGGRIVTR